MQGLLAQFPESDKQSAVTSDIYLPNQRSSLQVLK